MAVPSFRIHGVRYQTRDVNRAVEFDTQQLGFELKHQRGTAFASVSCGGTDVLLSGPGSSGTRPLPDGQQCGKQIQRLDPDGNPIELLEPASRP